MRPVGRRDLAALHLPGHGVEIVEGDLLPMDVQSAYDGHRDLLKLRRGARSAPHANCLRSMMTRLSWGGLPAPGRRPQLSSGPMHVIYMSEPPVRGLDPPGRPPAPPTARLRHHHDHPARRALPHDALPYWGPGSSLPGHRSSRHHRVLPYQTIPPPTIPRASIPARRDTRPTGHSGGHGYRCTASLAANRRVLRLYRRRQHPRPRGNSRA